ncbi:MAG: hypothetical protein KDA28_04515, partial [Phycisphaerales bacterium]|nr:hypothetical protein [Phycisphaerales bacterium]
MAIRGFAVLVIVLALVVYVLARTSVTRAIVLPHIERLILADAEADKVLVGLDGNIRLTNLRIHVPGVEGEAAELLVARRVVVHVNWGARVRGGPTVEKIEMRQPVLRISQDVRTGDVTLAHLPDPGDDDGGPLDLPEIVCSRGTIELGEHDGDRYQTLRTIRVDGTLSPVIDETAAYRVSVRELPDSPTWRGDGISIGGLYTEESFDLTVSGVALSDWPSDGLPSRIRPIFEALQLDGAVERTRFHIDKAGDFEATLELAGVSLNLPFDSAGRFQNSGDHLRMTRVDGTITVSNHQFIAADLSGYVEDLPYEVEFRYDGMTPDSPFRCDLHTRGFALDREPRLLPLAPRIVHRRLESFSYPTMLIDFDVSISRTGSDIDVEGDIRFTEGVASYEDFPYPFEGLEGHVTFNADEVRIHGVTGRSRTGATVQAQGWIAPPVDGAAAHLEIEVQNIPFDETLLEGLSPARRELIDAL